MTESLKQIKHNIISLRIFVSLLVPLNLSLGKQDLEVIIGFISSKKPLMSQKELNKSCKEEGGVPHRLHVTLLLLARSSPTLSGENFSLKSLQIALTAILFATENVNIKF